MEKLKWAVGCTAILALSGCDLSAVDYLIDVEQPDKASLEAAFQGFNKIAPTMRAGRWAVSLSPVGVELKGVDKEAADRIRAAGRALNTLHICRHETTALDTYSQISILTNLRRDCNVKSFKASADTIEYESQCRLRDWIGTKKIQTEFAADGFTTIKTEVSGREGTNESERSIQYDGKYVGECTGDEIVQPVLWPDRR